MAEKKKENKAKKVEPIIKFRKKDIPESEGVFAQKNSLNYESVSSVLASDLAFEGNILQGDSLRLEGSLKGNINITGSLIIGRNSVVEGEIRAGIVHIIGTVVGDVYCEQLKLLQTSKLTGDVYVDSIIIDEGATFIGKCRTRENDVVPTIDSIIDSIY